MIKYSFRTWVGVSDTSLLCIISTVIYDIFPWPDAISSIKSLIPWITIDLRLYFLSAFLLLWLCFALFSWSYLSGGRTKRWNIAILIGALSPEAEALRSLISSSTRAKTVLRTLPAANSWGYAFTIHCPILIISAINSFGFCKCVDDVTLMRNRHAPCATWYEPVIYLLLSLLTNEITNISNLYSLNGIATLCFYWFISLFAFSYENSRYVWETKADDRKDIKSNEIKASEELTHKMNGTQILCEANNSV